MNPLDRFWAQVQKSNECWLWTGAKQTTGGYGIMHVSNIRHRAHRFSYELHNGPIPPGLCVLHRCDVPACVNPDHLWTGTRADNTKDMIKKGRAAYQNGRGSK